MYITMPNFSEYTSDTREINQALNRYIETIPALFWRINLVRETVEYLNDYRLPELERTSSLLLQNKKFANEIVLEEDRFKFQEFVQSIRERKEILRVIRINAGRGSIRWLKFYGIPDPHDFTYYQGYIMDVTETVYDIMSMDSEMGTITSRIELFDTPVILLEIPSKKLYGANNAARHILGLDDPHRFKLGDILFARDEQDISRIFEHLIFHDLWEGELVYVDKENSPVPATSHLKSLIADGRQLIWLNFQQTTLELNGGECEGLSEDEEQHYITEMKAAAEAGSMEGMLRAMIDHQPLKGLTDSILYSHISTKKDIVMVWGTGSSFNDIDDGAVYPYEGTIAENIENFNLPYLVMEDTMESIKPIDWALFIPQGVRSYLAIPFYEANILKTVLIFCSRHPRRYEEAHFKRYQCLYDHFSDMLPLWKKSHQKNTPLP